MLPIDLDLEMIERVFSKQIKNLPLERKGRGIK